MKRNLLIKLLEEYRPTNQEIGFKNDILMFIKANENCFERELKIGHITGSAWLINQAGDKALLMHHSKLDKWLQPGGHADSDSNILAVAIKEAQEESGINSIEPVMKEIFDIDIHQIPSNSKDDLHFHYDIRFLLQVQSNEILKINEEAKELRWVSSKETLPTEETSILRMFNKWVMLFPN